jgi:hypothetical protein
MTPAEGHNNLQSIIKYLPCTIKHDEPVSRLVDREVGMFHRPPPLPTSNLIRLGMQTTSQPRQHPH